ncbi:MFS transporter [Streptomyces sp. NPDC014724]|uniref:MFS transporter n=1 Tax=unclassified Streptomyces TaxID=2593676 RepID=UPI0036FD0E65
MLPSVSERYRRAGNLSGPTPPSLSMVMNTFPEGTERNKALGIWGGLGGFGATAGLLLGGIITDIFVWQWVFWINVPVGTLVLVLAPPCCVKAGTEHAPVPSMSLVR